MEGSACNCVSIRRTEISLVIILVLPVLFTGLVYGQKVGIHTNNPQHPFQVNVDSVFTYPPVIDQQSLGFTGSYILPWNGRVGQQVVCGTSGRISEIEVFDEEVPTPFTIRVWTSGSASLLGEEIGESDDFDDSNEPWVSMLFSDPPYVQAGDTIFLEVRPDGFSHDLGIDSMNGYIPGSAFYLNIVTGIWVILPSQDLRFKVHTMPIDTVSMEILKVRADSKVSIKNYTLPASDGLAGQLLQTNGIGQVSWTSLDNTAVWKMTGNAGTGASNFLGPTNSLPMLFKINNQKIASWDGTTGNYILGYNVMMNNVGTLNIAVGNNAIVQGNNIVTLNIALGDSAMYNMFNANDNTVIGAHARSIATSGALNIAVGTDALKSATLSTNVAMGTSSMRILGSGFSNVGLGYSTMIADINGDENTAIGAHALYSNTGSVSQNVAVGFQSLSANTQGQKSVALGYKTLFYNTTGSQNCAIGYDAGPDPAGASAGSKVGLGNDAGAIGNLAQRVEIGNTSVSWIGGQVGWSTYSDGRIKDDVHEDIPGLTFINQLRPVTYTVNLQKERAICNIPDTARWPGYDDVEHIVHSGFIAQEVDAAARQCQYSFNGISALGSERELYSLQYAAFTVPLIKALKELSAEKELREKELSFILEKLEVVNNTLEKKIADLRQRTLDLRQIQQSGQDTFNK